MTPRRIALLLATAWLAYAVIIALLLNAYMPRVVKPPPAPLPTAGVPGCTASSTRTVLVPAGVTVAFSCPTHIEVSSADTDTHTIITFRRPRH